MSPDPRQASDDGAVPPDVVVPGGAVPARPWRRRRVVVLGVLAVSAAVLALAQAAWVTATTASPVADVVPLAVAGHRAAPASVAGALVAAAAALALSLAGRWGARAASGAVVLAGVLVVAGAAGVLLDPLPAAEGVAREVVGVGSLTGGAQARPVVAVASVGGAALTVLGVLGVLGAARWSVTGERHRVAADGVTGPAATGRPGGTAPEDDRDTWDALSRGEDPT